jgi:hypothetical protein
MYGRRRVTEKEHELGTVVGRNNWGVFSDTDILHGERY